MNLVQIIRDAAAHIAKFGPFLEKLYEEFEVIMAMITEFKAKQPPPIPQQNSGATVAGNAAETTQLNA